MIQAGNEAFVQQILVYICKSPVDLAWAMATFDCHSPANATTMLGVRQNCDSLIAAWSMGGAVRS